MHIDIDIDRVEFVAASYWDLLPLLTLALLTMAAELRILCVSTVVHIQPSHEGCCDRGVIMQLSRHEHCD